LCSCEKSIASSAATAYFYVRFIIQFMLVLFYAEITCCQYLRLSSAVTQDMSQKRQPVNDDVIVIDSDEEIPETLSETQVPETQQYFVGGAAGGAASAALPLAFS
jgi:hypothetical protein